ncbi:HHLA1 protein, partial [Grantiella picta]|nr:HHLA1 protein [Grantiella picta]
VFLHFSASCIRRENKKEKQVAVLATAELPAKSLDLAAINLTELVNGMLSTALRGGTKKFFSLLSVTSYSSFAFHKVSVTIYNISNAKNIDPGKFPMHYCYCLNNMTNDLTDFTALLVDIIGNSTSYLTEIFKSTSILSVRQSNDSDCIYICVMAGQTGKNLSDFLEILEKSPLINYTFSSNTSSDLDLDSIFSSFVKLQEDPNKTLDSSAEHAWTFKCEHILSDLNFQRLLLVTQMEKIGDNHTTAALILLVLFLSFFFFFFSFLFFSFLFFSFLFFSFLFFSFLFFSFLFFSFLFFSFLFFSFLFFSSFPSSLPFSEPQDGICRDILIFMSREHIALELIAQIKYRKKSSRTSEDCVFSPGCPQAMLREPRVTSPPVTLIVQKINPCVMELCRFFQLCLCVGQRRYSRKEAMRYCVEYYSWFVKNASYVCERGKRVAYSHTLKQKCLKNICTSV